MKRTRITWITALLLLMLIGTLAFVCRSVSRYPASGEFLPALHSFVSEHGFRVLLEKRRDSPSTPEPLVLRVRGIGKTGDVKNRLGGVGSPYRYCYVSKYESVADGTLELDVDITGGKVYHVTVVGRGASTRTLSMIENYLRQSRISVRTEEGR
jgi:hypothetical protein